MSTRQIAYAALLAALYVVVGQFTGRIPNPMVPGANLALNMTVVVIAGSLLGPLLGGLVGLLGTLLNAVSPAGNPFEYAAIIPHTIMGITAGLIARVSMPAAALAIIVGHVLNIAAFVTLPLGPQGSTLLPLNQLTALVFSVGLLVEAVIDLIVIWLAVAVLRPVVRSAPV